MKIGDEVYIHGYIDEIRFDTVIIKNDGGYFVTAEPEVVLNQPEPCGDVVSREEAKWGVFCNCDHAKNQANAKEQLTDFCQNCEVRMLKEKKGLYFREIA